MFDILFETGVNIFQSIMYMGFLFLFFDKTDSKSKNIAAFLGCSSLFFTVLTYYTFFVSYLHFLHSLDFIIYILVMEVYTIFFLKGDKLVKPLIPIMAYLINTIISYTFSYIVSYFIGESHYSLATRSNIYRYLCIVFINIINTFVFLLLIKIKTKELKLMKWTDLITFILIPIMTIVIIYSTLQILYLTDFKSEILVFPLIICVCMISVAVIIWIMMTRISKDYEIKTQLLLVEQKSNLYEFNIIQTNSQIEKISKIKHDMKNNLLCIATLIEKDEFEEVKKICDDVSERLTSIYTPISTPNALLNAVINVELEKASNFNISFSVLINDYIMPLASNSDLISIIGNICDNAIDYLKTVNEEFRTMSLEILKHNNYYIITCKNKILISILQSNPDLSTRKIDKVLHGKGIEILRNNVKKYDGDIKFYEKDGMFCCTVVLKILENYHVEKD